MSTIYYSTLRGPLFCAGPGAMVSLPPPPPHTLILPTCQVTALSIDQAITCFKLSGKMIWWSWVQRVIPKTMVVKYTPEAHLTYKPAYCIRIPSHLQHKIKAKFGRLYLPKFSWECVSLTQAQHTVTAFKTLIYLNMLSPFENTQHGKNQIASYTA